MFSLNESNLFILSLTLSILFFSGLTFIGKFLIDFLKLRKSISDVSNVKYQYSIVGIIVITFVIYPFYLFNIINILIIKLLSLSIIILGIVYIINNISFKFFIIKKFKSEYILYNLILLCFILISISPVTNADSLDYHIGVPYYVLNNELYPNLKFWMHFTKSGAGEIFYTLPLSINAINVLGLTQISALLSISGVLLNNFKKELNSSYVLFFISCPVLIFLISSAKPQLIYVASSTLIFSLVFFGNNKIFKQKSFYLLSSIFLITNIIGKFSFALSSSLLVLAMFYYSKKNKSLLSFILIFTIVFTYILFSRVIYLNDTYGLDLISSIISPLPLHLPGYIQLYNSLTSCGYSGCFPYWLIFPKDFNSLTEALGIASIILLFIKIKKNFEFYLPILLILIQIIISSIYGPNNARWYLEPMTWSIILVSIYGFRSILIEKIFFYLIKLQSIFVLSILIFAVYSLSFGSLTQIQYDKVMTKNADGYSLFKWSNSILKDDDILISTHRSFALSNIETIPGDLFLYIDINDKQNLTFYDEIKKLKPNYILFYDDKKNFDKFEECTDGLAYYKKDVGVKGSRNPFNRNNLYYDGYLYKFDHKKMPDCLIKN